MDLRLFVGIALVCITGFANADVDWTPQLGTCAFPKFPSLSQKARQGDVYKINDQYYRALMKTDFAEDPQALENLPDDSNEYWRQIHRGSFVLPKIFGVDYQCNEGDLFYIKETNAYYRADADGKVSNDWQNELVYTYNSMCQWETVNANENWMSLLRPEIGDKPLGDLILPGSHDAGTSGITEDSILVDNHFLFQVGDRLDSQFIANWSLTQPDTLDVQLMSGFRNLDLRIADTEAQDGQFRWWHGMAGDEIGEGLSFIGQFARDHPEEILVLLFQHFATPGDATNPTYPISEARLDTISDMILAAMGDRMAYRSNFTTNPTMNELLATGRNIMTNMDNAYIRAKDDRFWEVVIHEAWQNVSSPEELFAERSGRLRDFKDFHSNEITDLSGCTTANDQIIVAAMINVYGENGTFVKEIIDELVPPGVDVNPANMSFEGLWMDLRSKATYGTNTDGMWERPAELFTSGASVHYYGVNEQARHWIARPDLYKPNIIYVDDLPTSTLVDTAIEANSGNIVREVTIAHQGNPKDGYFEWADEGFGTIGGADGVNCIAVDVQYIISDLGGPVNSGILYQQGTIDISEGLYPPTATIELEVMSAGSNWTPLWSGNIQDMIDNNYDVYVRGMDLGAGTGFAYLSTAYDDYGEECSLLPMDTSNIIASVQW